MSLSKDLLQLAVVLKNREPSKPKQSSLRRSISTAYYALFHRLIEASTTALFGGSANNRFARSLAGRSFDHSHMKIACNQILSGNFDRFLIRPTESSRQALQIISQSFKYLQEERHKSDYNTTIRITKSDATSCCKQVENAFRQLAQLKQADPDAYNQFLTLLLFKSRD